MTEQPVTTHDYFGCQLKGFLNLSEIELQITITRPDLLTQSGTTVTCKRWY